MIVVWVFEVFILSLLVQWLACPTIVRHQLHAGKTP
jgi:hypothetical protein